MNKGRFTKYKYDITSISNHKYSEYHRSNPFIIIDSKKFALIKLKARELFVRRLASKPLNIIIMKYNAFIKVMCTYYNISRESRIKLNSLEPFFYKKI